MPRRPDLAALERALGDGALVVCWCGVAEDIEAARRAARALGDATLALAGFEGRLFRSRTAGAGSGAIALSVSGPIGIDVEAWHGLAPDDAMIEMTATALERSAALRDPAVFAGLWTRKEAALKAFGVGLAMPPGRLEVGPAACDWRLVGSPWGGQAKVRSIVAPEGHAAAVATQGPASAVRAFRARADGTAWQSFTPVPA